MRQSRIESDWEYLRRVIGTPQENFVTDYNISISTDTGSRDLQMEKTLRTVVSLEQSRRIATVTGFFHILDDPQQRNLYGKVRDLSSQRRFLY